MADVRGGAMSHPRENRFRGGCSCSPIDSIRPISPSFRAPPTWWWRRDSAWCSFRARPASTPTARSSGRRISTRAAGRSRTCASRCRAANATEADVAKLTIYVVDYGDAALEAIMTAAIEVFGEDYPITASTLVGVATLWQPDLLIEIDAMAIC